MQPAPRPARRLRVRWVVLAALVAVLVPVAIIALPILTHQNQGLSGQQSPGELWPLSVGAAGDDGRERTLSVAAEDGAGAVDTSTLSVGDRLVVRGAGYDGSRGIYVAICAIPDDPATKPGPCIGGVPDQATDEAAVGTVQYAPSNWINDDWAWKLFGARSYDDIESGTFTAYIEIADPVSDELDCTAVACGLYTRNDHTALNDRVQDLYIPVGFAASAG